MVSAYFYDWPINFFWHGMKIAGLIPGLIADLNPAYNAKKLGVMLASGAGAYGTSKLIENQLAQDGVPGNESVVFNIGRVPITSDTLGAIGATALGAGLNIAGKRLGGGNALKQTADVIPSLATGLRTGGDMLTSGAAGIALSNVAAKVLDGIRNGRNDNL